MAEAYMISLAAQLGRDKAHEVVYVAVRTSREQGTPLRESVKAAVGEALWTSVEKTLPEPEDYVGSAPEICGAALRDWRF